MTPTFVHLHKVPKIERKNAIKIIVRMREKPLFLHKATVL